MAPGDGAGEQAALHGCAGGAAGEEAGEKDRPQAHDRIPSTVTLTANGNTANGNTIVFDSSSN